MKCFRSAAAIVHMLVPFTFLLLFTFLLIVAADACGRQKSGLQLASDALARGLRAHSAGRLQEAEADYHQVLVYDPQNKFAYYNLGLVDQSSGRTDFAELEYRLALTIDPDYAPALYNLAVLRAAASAFQEAADLFRHVIALQPTNAAAHYNLGMALDHLGQQAQGQAEIARAIQLDPRLASAPAATATPSSAPRATPTPGP